jgi:hypothetical protein
MLECSPGCCALSHKLRLLAVAGALVLLALGVLMGYRVATKDWRKYVACPRGGELETRLGARFLNDAPVDRRYQALWSYFTHGFLAHLTPGGSRVQYCGAGSGDFAINGLEGFARTAPLLAAWVHSGRGKWLTDSVDGRRVDLIEVLRRGILSGSDPSSREYWGDIHDYDQRIVEAADVARTLWLTKSVLWDTLSDTEKRRVSAWLLGASAAMTPEDNWILLPVIVDLVVARLDVNADTQALMARAHRGFAHYKNFYLESGWFIDPPNGVDLYNTWGITYDLFWLNQVDASFEATFITGAIRDSSRLTEHLVSPHGIPIMGRSICYRTAVPVPILAEDLLEPSAAPGRALRALDVTWRYFISHGAVSDGALTQGYYASDLRFLDKYSGSGSCQWGLRSLVLAFMHGAEDPFWSGPQAPLPVEVSDYRLDFPRLGWRVEGHAADQEIMIDIPKNQHEVGRPEAYSWSNRLLETILRKPFRPSNHEIKYESRRYSSARPFPMGDETKESRTHPAEP